jgi:hypothetical protein
MDNQEKATDADERLEVLNFSECDNDSPEELKSLRGVIRRKSDGETVCVSFGYTDSYTANEKDKIVKRLGDTDGWDFFISIESSLLRVFFEEDRWYLCTHKKLDAFRSRWSCRQTFGELFAEGLSHVMGLEEMYGVLDPSRVYCFLLRSNQENRIANHPCPRESSVVYMGSFLRGATIEGFDPVPPECLAPLARPTPVEGITDADTLIARVLDTNPEAYQGIIAVHKETKKQVKVFHPEYYRSFQLRGNNPNLRFRFLELRRFPDKIDALYALYPRYAVVFDQYEDILQNVARLIYCFYVRRYIRNQFVTLPREEFLVMKKCHEWFLLDRKNNKVFSKKVFEVLIEEPAIHLYRIIKRFLVNQSLYQAGAPQTAV